jgi:CheY-like chemotaxis protein
MANPDLEGLRVAVFEDNPDTVTLVGLSLLGTPHKVVEQASTLEGALEVLGAAKPEELGIDVVLLDGNLDSMGVERGHDARTIWDRLTQINRARTNAGRLAILTLGISADSLRDYGLPLAHEHDITKIRVSELDHILDAIARKRLADS